MTITRKSQALGQENSGNRLNKKAKVAQAPDPKGQEKGNETKSKRRKTRNAVHDIVDPANDTANDQPAVSNGHCKDASAVNSMSEKTIKKKAAVDPLSGFTSTAEIVQDEDGTIWSCMLNWSDVSFGINGHNKYFSIQLICVRTNNYYIFTKFGRVGALHPQKTLKGPIALDAAKKVFRAKFAEKTGNRWQKPFVPVKSKYTMIDIEHAEESEDDAMPTQVEVPSKLEKPVQELLGLICNQDIIRRQVEEMNLDLKRLPLGKLSKNQISVGYRILAELAEIIAAAKNEIDDEKPDTRNFSQEMAKKTSEYYTIIPHNFGRKLPPTINTNELLQAELDLLQVLTDLEISAKIRNVKKSTKNIHDEKYDAIGAKMISIDPNSSTYKIIERYIRNTCQNKVKIDSIIEIEREVETEEFEKCKGLGNRQLLWHGSRISNWASILSNGMRIAPPEAPHNGYNFGKGLYFADMLEKSASYCYTSRLQPKGVLVLADVALGRCLEKEMPETITPSILEAQRPPCNSTKALGSSVPDSEDFTCLFDHVRVPYGIPTKVESSTWKYNEYIVYNTQQVKLRYVITVDFYNTDN